VGNIKVYAPYDHSDMSDWLSNPKRPESILPSQRLHKESVINSKPALFCDFSRNQNSLNEIKK
jgi:hypothetical protein